MQKMIVRSKLGQNLRTQLWNPAQPLRLGHPLKWVLVRTFEGKFRLHDFANQTIELRIGQPLPKGLGIELEIVPIPVQKPVQKEKLKPALHKELQSLLEKPSTTDEWKEMKKPIQSATAGLGLLLLLALVQPLFQTQESEEEIIPPQFAKIVMEEAKETADSPESGSDQAPASVQETAVAQAFESQALQDSMKSLLTGGMNTLLQSADFVGGTKANNLFQDSKLRDLAKVDTQKLKNRKSIKVAQVGGKKGKGYGTGVRAGVQGQGNAFVSLESGLSSVEEGLSKDEVGRVIHAHMSEIRYCYESAILKNPETQGKLMVDFTIGPKGSVVQQSVKDSSLGSVFLDNCILRRLVRWTFPKPKGGVKVAVTYPFIFKTVGR